MLAGEIKLAPVDVHSVLKLLISLTDLYQNTLSMNLAVIASVLCTCIFMCMHIICSAVCSLAYSNLTGRFQW